MDPTAVMGKRIGAYIIDAIIGIVITVVVFFAVADSLDIPVDPCGQDGSPAMRLLRSIRRPWTTACAR